MGPGGYRFTDYLKVGVPLTLIVLLALMLILPIFWPLTSWPFLVKVRDWEKTFVTMVSKLTFVKLWSRNWVKVHISRYVIHPGISDLEFVVIYWENPRKSNLSKLVLYSQSTTLAWLVIRHYVITEKSSSWYLDVIAGITTFSSLWKTQLWQLSAIEAHSRYVGDITDFIPDATTQHLV